MRHNVHELKVWEKAMDLVTEVYELTSRLPWEEKFGLVTQMRTSALSVPSNIAEGAGRNTDKEFSYFLGISNGSAYELMTQFMLACRLNFLKEKEVEQILVKLDEIQKMIYALQKRFSRQAA